LQEKAPGELLNLEEAKRTWSGYPGEEGEIRSLVLVDTSVWVGHFRKGEVGLETLLHDGGVVCHPFIVGELACRNLRNRSAILLLLNDLPMATQAEHEEVLLLIEHYRLMGRRLGFIDMHLLSSALLMKVPLWTFDQKLSEVSSVLEFKYSAS
jgi:predicted nucleic acid-binding protein